MPVFEEHLPSVGVQLRRPADPDSRQPFLGGLAHHAFGKVLARELDRTQFALELVGVLADPHDDLDAVHALTQPYELTERDRVDVFGLVQRDQKGEVELREGPLGQDRVLFEQQLRLRVLFLDEPGFVEQVDEVGEGEESRSAGHNDDPARPRRFQLEAFASRGAELDGSAELRALESGSQFAVIVDLEH